ncbi:hypothetical protein L2E82_15690 [Cichorium intybus]|uniref:Uncharacterized protein n=1 Tax=Cichorium intybus TaxID=13427 RepID=A0ACB9F3I4_CICIN|nr:hypothetical protein L2E82_15690 [Cichorium intybus]
MCFLRADLWMRFRSEFEVGFLVLRTFCKIYVVLILEMTIITLKIDVETPLSLGFCRGESNTKLGLLEIDHAKERKVRSNQVAIFRSIFWFLEVREFGFKVSPEAREVFRREFDFFEKVTSITGALYPLPKKERRAGIKMELEKIQLSGNDYYLPTSPNKLHRGIHVNSGIPLQSAAKVPIMITFDVVDRDGDPKYIKHQGCIFKHVLDRRKPHEQTFTINQLTSPIVQMSQQKFASNVVEKCLIFGTPEQSQILVTEMLDATDENEPLLVMMKD